MNGIQSKTMINAIVFLVFLTVCQAKVILPEDGRLNFSGIAVKYGQKAEEFDIVTQDGYIIKLFHIIGDRNKPVLLLHGILDSSDDFIIRGNTSLAVNLARNKYDVWALNHRGNRYSRRHTFLDPDRDAVFWDFSVHELGTIEAAQVIDFITAMTGSKVSVIGYSQGMTTALVLTATKPEYNDKINVLIGLAPVCYVHNTQILMSTVIKLGPYVNEALQMSRNEEFMGYYSPMKAFLNQLCTTSIGYVACIVGGMFPLTGFDIEEFEPEFLPVFIGHFPAGTSRKNLNHFAQIGNNRRFANYDYGPKNFLKYGSGKPPKYDLRNVSVKVALFSAKNDAVASNDDVKILKKMLPNVVEHHIMKQVRFNHLDFVWGKTMHKKVQPQIFAVLRKYTQNV